MSGFTVWADAYGVDHCAVRPSGSTAADRRTAASAIREFERERSGATIARPRSSDLEMMDFREQVERGLALSVRVFRERR